MVNKSISTKSLREKLENSGLKLIPAAEILIEPDPYVTTGYDFTVEDNYTFELENGVFVQDTMAVILPQTNKSQQELKSLLTKTLFAPATGEFKYKPAWDVVFGLYQFTKYDEKNEKVPPGFKIVDFDETLNQIINNPSLMNKIYTGKIFGKGISVPVGLYMINMILPDFYREPVTNTLTKKEISRLLNNIAQKEYEISGEVSQTLEFYNKLVEVGSKISTIKPLSFELASLDEVKKRLGTIIDSIGKKDLLSGYKTLESVMEKVKQIVKQKDPDLYESIESGARGSWGDVQQMLVMKGYLTDPVGRVFDKPVKSSLGEGLDKKEFFQLGYSARKGIIDRAINTSAPGYLLRRLVLSTSPVILDPRLSDCGTKRGFKIEVDEDTAKAITGRYLINGKLIDDNNYKTLIGKTVELRSPMFCKSVKVCKKCYGVLHEKHNSTQIGVIAAHAIGERVQQTIMKTFHTGGLAKIEHFPEVLNNEAKKYLKQEGDKIYLNKDINLKIEIGESIESIVGDTLIIKSGLIKAIVTKNGREGSDIEKFSFIFEDEKLELEIFYDDIIVLENDKRYAYIKGKKDPVMKLWFTTTDISTQIKIIEKLFNATIEIEDYREYFNALWKLFKHFGIKMVHLEVVFSQMMRWKDDPRYPFRLKHEVKDADYVIIGSKQIPYYESILSALAFENVDKAIESAVIYGESTYRKHKSSIEVLLDGDIEEFDKIFR